MTEVVVDTDVVSFLFKNYPIGRLYAADVNGRAAAVSFMTVAEVERWALQHQWGPQRIHGSDYLGVPGLKLISHSL